MNSRDVPSLAQLVAAVRDGDEQSQHDLHELCNSRFRQFAGRYLSWKGCCAPEQHGVEVTDAGWDKIFSKVQTLRENAKFIAWAMRIVRNEANEHLRRCIDTQQHEVSFDSLKRKVSGSSQENEISFDPASIVDDKEVIYNALFADQIMSIAKEVSPELYEILRLHKIEGLKLADVAKRLGKSYVNTRIIYSRGMRRLKSKLEVKKLKRKS